MYKTQDMHTAKKGSAMSYRDWYAGMKVVCVDNTGEEDSLVVGRVYTLSAIYAVGTVVYVELVEDTEAAGWFPWRFRPVQRRATDISVFKALLNKAPAERTPA